MSQSPEDKLIDAADGMTLSAIQALYAVIEEHDPRLHTPLGKELHRIIFMLDEMLGWFSGEAIKEDDDSGESS